MIDSLRTLLSGIIDYAGLFPPARLPMGTSVRNYFRYKRASEEWILGRFVCPASRLVELEAELNRIEYAERLPTCVIASGKGSQGLIRSVQSEITAALRRLRHISPETLEVQIPAEELSLRIRRYAVELLQCASGMELYLELPFSENWRQELPDAIAKLAENGNANVKIRLGGASAAAVPSAEQVATFISVCAKYGVPFKATAGLHHPLRKIDTQLQCETFGFLNIFVAAAVAHHYQPEIEVLIEILSEGDSGRFHFRTDGMDYRNFLLTNAQVQASREFARSFGSCSVEEPIEDMRRFGYTTTISL